VNGVHIAANTISDKKIQSKRRNQTFYKNPFILFENRVPNGFFRVGYKTLFDSIYIVTSRHYLHSPLPFSNSLCFLFFYLSNILSLAPHPHINPLPEHLGLHSPAVLSLLHDLGRGQAVQYGLNGGSGVAELDVLQPAAVHELHPLAELALLETVAVGYAEVLIQHLEGRNAVDAVDGREKVAWVFKVRLVLQKGGQIEVVLREHDAHRM